MPLSPRRVRVRAWGGVPPRGRVSLELTDSHAGC